MFVLLLLLLGKQTMRGASAASATRRDVHATKILHLARNKWKKKAIATKVRTKWWIWIFVPKINWFGSIGSIDFYQNDFWREIIQINLTFKNPNNHCFLVQQFKRFSDRLCSKTKEIIVKLLTFATDVIGIPWSSFPSEDSFRYERLVSAWRERERTYFSYLTL